MNGRYIDPDLLKDPAFHNRHFALPAAGSVPMGHFEPTGFPITKWSGQFTFERLKAVPNLISQLAKPLRRF